jgi:hypothetical protein
MLFKRPVLICLIAVNFCFAGIVVGKAVKLELGGQGIESSAAGKAMLDYSKGADKTEIQVNCKGMEPNTEFIVLLYDCTDEGTSYIKLGSLTTNKKGKGTLHTRAEGDVSGLSVAVLGDDGTSVQLYGGSGLIPVPMDPLPVLWITGSVSIEHLGGEPGMEYCGHRYDITFQSNAPTLRLCAAIFDYNPSENTVFEDLLYLDLQPCYAYGVLRENFGGFFIDDYPGVESPIIYIYPNDSSTPENGITSGQRCIGRMKLTKRDDPEVRPNAPDLIDTWIILKFSNNIEIVTTLRESGDYLTAAGHFSWSPLIFVP